MLPISQIFGCWNEGRSTEISACLNPKPCSNYDRLEEKNSPLGKNYVTWKADDDDDLHEDDVIIIFFSSWWRWESTLPSVSYKGLTWETWLLLGLLLELTQVRINWLRHAFIHLSSSRPLHLLPRLLLFSSRHPDLLSLIMALAQHLRRQPEILDPKEPSDIKSISDLGRKCGVSSSLFLGQEDHLGRRSEGRLDWRLPAT